MHDELIKDIGERELIGRLSRYMPKNQTSDDCAFLEINSKNLLINTDLMVENTHFNHQVITPTDLGWKSVITNYSDLISSGCNEFIGINIGLVLPPNTQCKWVEELYKGINQALYFYGGSILGGDCSKGENKIVSICALGIQGKLKFRRYGCAPNEILLTTGIHGLSKLGFLIQSGKLKNQNFSSKLIKDSTKAFLRPEIRFEIQKMIEGRYLNDQKNIIGCTDTSDGLFQGAMELAKESKCSVIIDYTKIPKHIDWPEGDEWNEYYFFGGEDYQLLFSMPRELADNLLKDKNIYEIGYIKEGNPSVKITNCEKVINLENQSFSHF